MLRQRPRLSRRQRGVSLVEALVALGVMAFGMLAVVGMQSTLRSNGDLARQRAEAVRIAQDAIEEWRGFTVMNTSVGRTAYADIVSQASVQVAGVNATYVLKRQVNSPATVANTVAPQRRTVVVDVEWQDRSGLTQNVRLPSMIVGLDPAVTASTVLAANPDSTVQPLARQRSIPSTAVVLSGGRSGYVPPGQTDPTRVAWVFNNLTGVITLCTTTGTTSQDLQVAGTAPVCGTDKALLLSGAIRYTPDDPSISANVANPSGNGFPTVGLVLKQTLPDATTQDRNCFQTLVVDTQIGYYCAVPLVGAATTWTGRLVFGLPLSVALSTADFTSGPFKVCRYQAAATYTNVSAATVSQNFLIIKAGTGSAPGYTCPTATTPRTWAHQPV